MTDITCGGCRQAPSRCTCPSSLTPDGDAAGWLVAVMLETAEGLGVSLAATRYRVYALDFQAYQPAAVIAAFRAVRVIPGKKFYPYPTPAEILECIAGTPEDAALLAWAGLVRAAEEVGAYRSLEIEDPVTAAALLQACGSWSAFCALERGAEMALKQREFLAAYRAALRAPGTGPVRVAGLLESGTQYERRAASWTARLTAAGDVVQVREVLVLPAGTDVNRLTAGKVETHGEATATDRPPDA